MVRAALTVAYQGAPFHGFARQPGQVTVAGVLGAAIERHVRHAVELTCAGRTDRGVHARGQVVSLDVRADVDFAALVRGLNRALRPSVVVRAAGAAPDGFDARHDARWRRYRYRIRNRPTPDPFSAGLVWHVERPLDVAAMRLACDPLMGEHDFSAFCRRPPDRGGAGGAPPSLVRRVTDAGWRDDGAGELRFEIQASSFCHQMVRSMVGVLVEVGSGKRRAGEVAGVVRGRDRAAAGQLAPPEGLYLWDVGYDPALALPLPDD